MSRNKFSSRWDFFCFNHASAPSKWGWVALGVVVAIILVSAVWMYYA